MRSGWRCRSIPGGGGGVGGETNAEQVCDLETDICQVLAHGHLVWAWLVSINELMDWLHGWIDATVDQGAMCSSLTEPHWYPGDLRFIGKAVGAG